MTAKANQKSREGEVAARLEAFAAESRSATLRACAQKYVEAPTQHRDEMSTELMRSYQETGSNEAFSFLYELNQDLFLRSIYNYLRSPNSSVDAADVLQEVFFNIYRYPYKFKPDRNTAFRNWTGAIIRNTAIQFGRKSKRDRDRGIASFPRDENTGGSLVVEVADAEALSPLETSSQREEVADLTRAWVVYLHYYLQAVQCLTPREKRALHLVEVQGLAYSDAAKKLDTQKVNLKMIIFRARRKIFSIMRRRMQTSQSLIERTLVAAG